MAIAIGDRIPPVTLCEMAPEGPIPCTYDEIFAEKRVALFSVPGAFTPTCSTKHVPGYLRHAADIKRLGIDEVACVSVNDAFVMEAWARSLGVGEEIRMLSDGNAELATALGLELDARRYLMGIRSRRFSLIADDGVVTHLNVEEVGEFKVSAAEVLMEQLSR